MVVKLLLLLLLLLMHRIQSELRCISFYYQLNKYLADDICEIDYYYRFTPNGIVLSSRYALAIQSTYILSFAPSFLLFLWNGSNFYDKFQSILLHQIELYSCHVTFPTEIN